ncbi:MAG: gliding motility protein GldL [Bacteroidota bacterium]|nr:gliding motility protein GldL [Bacteroidota bacterium]
MSLKAFVRTNGYRNFMAKLYGWGASLVILGALFKINHYVGADYMLILGMCTESIIFFFSAFEPPHVEPDWSLVYPQLAGIYHGGNGEEGMPGMHVGVMGGGDSVSRELDQMLTEAKVGPELIESLGQGLKNLSETTSRLSDVSEAALANDQYVSTMKNATQSASALNEQYKKSTHVLEENVAASSEHSKHLSSVSKNVAALSDAYSQASQSIKEELTLNKEFSQSLSNATDSANKFVETYNHSAELLSKTSQTLTHSSAESDNFNKQLQKVSANLSALNALYELHLQNSKQEMASTNKVNESMSKLLASLQESSASTNKYKENLSAINKIIEQQISGSSQQTEIHSKLQDSMKNLLSNLNDSAQRTTQFKNEVDSLAKNIAALNKVYGNMLSAMNVSIR